MDLFNMAEQVFKWVFKEDPDYFIFMMEFMEFLNGTGRFLDEMMRLESLKANYAKEMSPYPGIQSDSFYSSQNHPELAPWPHSYLGTYGRQL
jgi:hypothetical protein